MMAVLFVHARGNLGRLCERANIRKLVVCCLPFAVCRLPFAICQPRDSDRRQFVGCAGECLSITRTHKVQCARLAFGSIDSNLWERFRVINNDRSRPIAALERAEAGSATMMMMPLLAWRRNFIEEQYRT